MNQRECCNYLSFKVVRQILTNWCSIEVKSWNKNNGETPEYISVSAGGADAICISSITVTSAHTADILALLPGEVASVCNTRNHN